VSAVSLVPAPPLDHGILPGSGETVVLIAFTS